MPGMEDLARTERIAWEVAEGRPPDDAARALCDVLGQCDAYASLIDPRTGQGIGEGFAYLDPALIELMATRFNTPDTSPFIRAMPRMRSNVFHHCNDILDMNALRRTEFYADWWVPSGVGRHAGGIMLPAPDGRLAWVVIGCLGDRDWLDAEEARFAEAACGGIARALRTTAAMTHQNAFCVVAARSPDPAWLLDGRGRVHLMNDIARDLPHDAALRRLDGRIVMTDPAARPRLTALLHDVRRGGEGGRLVAGHDDAFAEVTVEPGPTYRDERTVLVSLRAPRPMAWGADDLRAAFGLAPSEAQAAMALATGASTSQIAEGLGVENETVRIYLKRTYAKVGIHDRGALIAFLLRGERRI